MKRMLSEIFGNGFSKGTRSKTLAISIQIVKTTVRRHEFEKAHLILYYES